MASVADEQKVKASCLAPKDQNQHNFPASNVSIAEIERIRRECKEESFWHRGLPLSLGSMLVVQGLVANGTFKASPRFGALPKMALAGVFGFGVGTMSYIRTCQKKFESIGVQPFGPKWFVWKVTIIWLELIKILNVEDRHNEAGISRMTELPFSVA